jgi:hypothetical protein
MSFVTGTPQRRGHRAATVGTSFRDVFASRTPYPKSDQIKQAANANRASAKRRKTHSIGDDAATGLVIHGSHEMDTMEGTDPDSATPPISGSTLADPDFPISYTGRGTMKFVSPIRIATVDGPLNVNGEVYSSSGLLAGASEVASWSIEVGETGAGNNFTKDAANSFATYQRNSDNVILHVHYEWTSKGSVGAGSNLFIKGLPFTTEAQVHKTTIHTTGITPVQVGSYYIVDGPASSTELQLHTAGGGLASEVAVTGSLCSTSGSISFTIAYHGVIP